MLLLFIVELGLGGYTGRVRVHSVFSWYTVMGGKGPTKYYKDLLPYVSQQATKIIYLSKL